MKRHLKIIDQDTGADVEIILLRGEEWSALFVDGVAVVNGDHYLAEEWIHAATGIETDSIEPSELLFPDNRNSGSLQEVRKRITDYKIRQNEAERIEREAADLFERAKQLRELK